MSWMQKLYTTYEQCAHDPDFTDPPLADGEREQPGLMPISHISQQAHICITLNAQGEFQGAELLPPKTQIIIPATEKSAGRTSGSEAHPLADKIHYCAGDYNGSKKHLSAVYLEELKAWCDSPYAHPKAQAVLSYVRKANVQHDLVRAGCLLADAEGVLLEKAPAGMRDTIFSRVASKNQGDALIVWRVLMPGDSETATWKDASLHEAWIAYAASQMDKAGTCMVQGMERPLGSSHPRNIRHPGDGAKLISSNDATNYTFRGHFTEPVEACSIGFEVSQKAHNALRWLIARQGYRNGEQVVLAWAENGVLTPQPCEEFLDFDDEDFAIDSDAPPAAGIIPEPFRSKPVDLARNYAGRLKKALRGYKQDLSAAQGIAIMALDSATPGRLAVTFYREQLPQEYLDNLEKWQLDMGWILPVRVPDSQRPNKEKTVFTPCAPTPDAVARVAYGRRMDDKLRKAITERLLPCIVDVRPLPRDLMESCVRRACNRVALEAWEWQEVLAVACALYKGFYARYPDIHQRRSYSMSLDATCTSRDYLYGRLLAVAEYVERSALKSAGENRSTNAERLMQRFADQPCATWRQLRVQLAPYLQRMRNSEKLAWLPPTAEIWMQEIHDLFRPDEFTSPRKLSGEFLLGYNCQMSAFYNKGNKKENTSEDSANEGANA